MSYEVFDRQLIIWGEAGQNLLSDSSILVMGSDILGRELVKSATILGVGNIYFMDNKRAFGEQPFLDIKIEDEKSIVDFIAKTIPEKLTEFNNDVCIHAIHDVLDGNMKSLAESIDFMVDATNSPDNHKRSIEASDRYKIPLMVVCSNDSGGIMSFYNPETPFGDHIITGFESQRNGVISSNLFSGLTLEEFRKNIFKKKREYLVNAPNDDQAAKNYLKKVDKSRLMAKKQVYSLIADDRITDPRTIDDFIGDIDLSDKSVLIIGGGAIGNYVADMLARFNLAMVDVADFDVYKQHNLNRQPLAYGRVRELKSLVLSERIFNISTTISESGKAINSRYIKGKVCEELTMNEKHDGFTLMNMDWFRDNRYDLIIGCFDGFIPRELMNRYATNLGFTYLDGASSTDSATAAVYIPSVTKCLRCGTFNLINLDSKIANEAKQIERLGCAQSPDGSINMSNQISAALLVNEGINILLKRISEKQSDYIRYFSGNVTKLNVYKEGGPCNCR